jgi:hypothetical protein
MKKFIMGGIVMLVIGAAGFEFYNLFLNDKSNNQNDMINFQLYGNYAVDASGVRDFYSLIEGAPLIGFFQIDDANELREWKEVLGLTLPNDFVFNFDEHQDRWLLITFGRELVEMRYGYRKSPYYEEVPFTEIIFDERLHDQTMFVYTMEKIQLWPSDLAGYGYNSFYVMNGVEKVFVGNTVKDFNKQSPNFKEGI